jgi:hypothetical protein
MASTAIRHVVPTQDKPASFAVLVTAILAFPRLTASRITNQTIPKEANAVYPRGADEELRDECTYDDEGEPAARDALNRVSSKGAAASVGQW